MKNRLLSIVILSCMVYTLHGQTTDSTQLTLDRIFKNTEFTSERFGPVRWLEDGSSYTTLEGTRGERELVRYDAKTGKREVLVPSSRLTPAGTTRPLSIEDYEWSPDGQKLLIFTNTKRVWRVNSRGDYWVVDLKTWDLKKLGRDAPPSTLMFAKFSPDGGRVAYVRSNNIYVQDLKTGSIKQLTTDGSRTIINGTFDWVYEEEFFIRDGFRWSPDGKMIAYWQLDADGVRDFYLINNTDSLYSYIIPIQYPKVGTTLSACRVGVIKADGGQTTWFEVPGDPRNNYIPRMEWAASSQEVVFQHLNRHQNANVVMLGDARSGRVWTVFTDRDSTWVNVVNDLKWFDGGKRFTWVSERDGWRHVYLVSRDGKEIQLVTPGEYDVVNIVNLDEKGRWLYVIASPENPTQRLLFRIRMDGKGKPERLTPANEGGTHSYTVSPNAQWALHTYSWLAVPPTIELIRLPKHDVVRTLVDDGKLRAKLSALERGPVDCFKVDIGIGVVLDAWMMKPPKFDATKKHPLLIYVYGEPAGQTVQDSWGGNTYLWNLFLTQQGYIVASVDNRGTPAPRGRAWRKSVYRQIGILASADQAAAVRKISLWSFIDTSRIGVWGWSGGGSMTLNAMFRYPDLYKTGMCVAPVSDQHLYNAIYQERYMGLPDENVEGFRDGSPVTFAQNLKGNLLIVHGSGDDNVHYQNTERVVNALIKANKYFTMMEYPNRSHGIFEGENTTRHLYGLLTWYLLTNMPPGPRP